MLSREINILRKKGLLKKSNNAGNIKIEQKARFLHLYNKSRSAEELKSKYLSLYDSLFRLFEYKLAFWGESLTGASPHSALKILLPRLYPESFRDNSINLKRLVAARHNAKKHEVIPNAEDFISLKKLVDEIIQNEGINV